MKNLAPLHRKMSYWDNIVNNKNLPNRIILQTLRNSVAKRVRIYSFHSRPNTLETIPPSTYVAPNIDILKSCYSKSNNLSFLKAKIKEKQNILFRAECQYCNIGEPTTFDHYLPQAFFPEFSALSTNLIPCCAKCNTEKGEEWLLNGNRRVINLYYDQLPTITYLKCSIIYKRNIPQAIFSLDLLTLPITDRPLIENHFNSLKLLDRYNSKSNSEISDVLSAISPQAGRLSRLEIQNHLHMEGQNIKNRKGNNYWRAIIRIALASSNQFLSDAGF